MNKPILIGFFLALVFGSVIYHYLNNRKNYSREWRYSFAGNHSLHRKASTTGLAAALRFRADFGHQRFFHPDMKMNAGLNKKGTPGLLQDNDPTGKDVNTPSTTVKKFDSGYIAFWVGITLALISLSLFLLFQIRKRQAVTEQFNVARADLITLFNNAPCGLHSIDEKGFIVNINNTLLGWLGYEKVEIVGKLKFTDLVGKDEQNGAEQSLAISQVSASDKVRLNLIKKSGETIPVILSVVRTDGLSKAPEKRLFSTVDNSECRDSLERIKHLDHELEAFSYSISHDLRAPLRSIDGYSRILQEDYAVKLDVEGKRVLTVIMNNAKRMGKLIDDLLEFGRLGRKTLQRSHLSMTGMVNSIVQELVALEPTRKIEVKVGQLHRAFVDVDMIRQVWFHLLQNAIKFTGKTDLAAIEIRSYQTGEGETCYEVKDNGVGFDMQYAPKLFGVFQRLHKMQDFSGTGVGLAIVKRIISRHGGRVWAEGILNQGVTFYFTIPIEDENT
ncbi:MAG: ATP-binding protein [Cyclobacteriaceae bacterium]